MIALGVVGTIEVRNGYISITPDEIRYVNWLRRVKTLQWREIVGYRANEHFTLVIPESDHRRRIKIGYTTERYSEIQHLLADHFPNLDKQEAQKEEAQLLTRAELGDNEQARESRLRAARRVALLLNWAGGLACIWLFLYPRPYELACWAGLLLPVPAVIALFAYSPLIRLDERKNSAYPALFIALTGPGLGLTLRSFFDVELLDYAPFWPVMTQAALLTAGVLALGARPGLHESAHRVTEAVVIVVVAVTYGFGAPYIVNYIFDDATPTAYRAVMLRKHSSSGKTTTYYLTTGPWGPRDAPGDVTVSSDYYRTVQPGDSVTILVRPGRLKVPWFTVAE